ncbi:hypothetical protein DCE93_01455 [Agromyces badenianii]|uniref:DUF3592 domain-containing protein n=1 Tax=Agromyces badenianii TaxID=2080742 RepID=A0A2S0WT65_9MICO|nr:hypothetical protein [Agromyces badenianii]AWB94502.1 hypothetical protein DCE93_01455 [Agromyces badenianii]
MDAAATVSVIAEVIAWFALASGLGCLLIALLIRVVDGPWLRTEAVVVDGDGGSVVRWFADGAFYSRALSPDERAHVTNPDEELAYYKQREPRRLRLHEPPTGRRVVGIVGIVLVGIAVVATVVGLVLMFVG